METVKSRPSSVVWFAVLAIMASLATAACGDDEKKKGAGDSANDGTGGPLDTGGDGEGNEGGEGAGAVPPGGEIGPDGKPIIPGGPYDPTPGRIEVDESAITAVMLDGYFQVTLPTRRVLPGAIKGTVQVRLRDIITNTIPSSVDVGVSGADAPAIGASLKVVTAGIPAGDAGRLAVEWFGPNQPGLITANQHGLFHVLERAATVVTGQDEFFAGTEAYLRLVRRNARAPSPIGGTPYRVLISQDEKIQELASGKTDELGVANPKLNFPAGMTGQAVLKIEIEGDRTETVEAPITLRKESKILLTTDKPLYQPGQLMHLRALALARPRLTAMAAQDALFEIKDGKGNKVFKKAVKTDDFGVAAAQFRLARQVNMGTYALKVTIGDSVAEKTVTVDRYTLPKFGIAFGADKPWYRPGDKVRATVDADYFFGKPVAGGSVKIEAQTYDVELAAFASLTGITDEDGVYAFDLELPKYFAGDALMQGNAAVFLEITVTDTANQDFTITRQLTVAQDGIIPACFPESATLRTGLPAKIICAVTDPMGKPIAGATLEAGPLDGGAALFDITTDIYGVATAELTVPAGQNLSFTLTAKKDGESAQRSFSFAPSPFDTTAAMRIRPGRFVYKVGDTVNLEAVTSGNASRVVFLDIIKAGQTIWSGSHETAEGAAHIAFNLTPEMAGTVQLNGYFVAADGNIIADSRLIQVDGADDLSIAVTADKPSYLPGETGKLAFEVKDQDGKGVTAAVGIYAVDEAVFALSENQPGLLKTYFKIEQELLEPKYQIKGFYASDVTNSGDDTDAEERERSAEVLLSAAAGSPSYGIGVNTGTADANLALSLYAQGFQTSLQPVHEYFYDAAESVNHSEDLFRLILKTVNPNFPDSWGNRLIFAFPDDYTIEISSIGPDETAGTSDDQLARYYIYDFAYGRGGGMMEGAEGPVNEGDWGDADGMAPGAGGEPPPEAAEGAEEPKDDNSGGGEGPRVRKYFPETLYVNPALITDASGKAEIDITFADSITSWRVTSLANSASGQLGSALTGITVFQDFFVDIDFPVSLTQNDEVEVPLAIYNYLEGDQEVTLTAKEESWFTLVSGAEQKLTVKSGQVAPASYRIKVKDVGRHQFTVTAIGSKMSDAVARSTDILPDGAAQEQVFSGMLSEDIKHTITIPEAAIPGASIGLVKVYPGAASQVVEGLDSMLQMPSGCFEQTSSSTYPNVLILNYMRETGQITPEIELKALDYISQGYQRLLTFEVSGGGFEWFGNSPAHVLLTAYGLLEFNDMNKVYEIDPAVISRTQNFLVGLQDADGSWRPNPDGYLDGAINNFLESGLRVTAYVAWALAESGYKGPALDLGMAWLKSHEGEAKDNYTLSIVANAFAAWNPSDTATRSVLDRLAAAAKTGGDKVYWQAGAQTECFSYGDVADIETTALSAFAFIRAETHLDLVGGTIAYLAGKKDSFGNWSSTQATIWSLRTMIAANDLATFGGAAKVTVTIDGKNLAEWDITPENADVLRQADFSNLLAPGTHEIALTKSGEASFMYQVVSTHYLPRAEMPVEPAGELAITVTYDKTELAVDDHVTVSVRVENNLPGERAEMVMVDLGLPPGFDVEMGDFDTYIEEKMIQKIETTPRQILVYLYAVENGKPVAFQYRLRAKYPLKAKTPESKAYPYYNPGDSASSAPVELTVAAQ